MDGINCYLFFVAIIITMNLSAKGVIPMMVIFPVAITPPLLIVLLMSKRMRKQWIDRSGLRVNGRSDRIIKETEQNK
jgi:predicted histidine transporter YuiF (NhaC family)